MKIKVADLQTKELRDLAEISRESIEDCMQCGKCSSGCPVVEAMDLLPHQVMRFLQLGIFPEVLASKTIWICASCFTCASRCPMDIDVTRVMEGLRVIALRQRGGNRLQPEEFSAGMLKDMPQQGLVSSFRKYTK